MASDSTQKWRIFACVKKANWINQGGFSGREVLPEEG